MCTQINLAVPGVVAAGSAANTATIQTISGAGWCACKTERTDCADGQWSEHAGWRYGGNSITAAEGATADGKDELNGDQYEKS
jgi:hypothetical protein